jgi:thiol:disulfide interchange protein DsbC
VFTDIDCGYCRKLHSQIKDYDRQGIQIRYLFYPRAGMDSESARKAEAVWCAKDRHQAMSDAKRGKSVSYRRCDNPVREHYLLGQAVGVTGTPALVLENGELIPGYIPPNRLRRLLDEKFPAEN